MSRNSGANQNMHPATTRQSRVQRTSSHQRTKGPDAPRELDASRPFALRAPVLHNPPDEIVQHPKGERNARPAGHQQHVLVIRKVNRAPAVRAVQHDGYLHALLLLARQLVQGPGPRALHARSEQ